MVIAIIPIIAGAAAALGAIIEGGGIVATVIGIGWTIWRIFTIIALVKATFWLACAAFAKDILEWFMQLTFWLMDQAFGLIGVDDFLQRLADLIALLPPKILELMAWLDIMDNVTFLLSCLFLNFALRSMPIVGGIFRG